MFHPSTNRRMCQARIGYRPLKKSVQRAVEKIHALTERRLWSEAGERGNPNSRN